MSDSHRWPDAVLVGLASSMRMMSGPGLAAARGRISGKPRLGLLAASTGELITDKTPLATDRTDPPALVGRIGAGGFIGNDIAGLPGAAAGAIGAGIGTFATFRARKLAVETTGLPDQVVAAGEDVIAYSLAAYATRPEPKETDSAEERPAAIPLWRGALIGLAAGVVGTAAMKIAQGAEFVLTDAEPSTMPATVAEKLKRRLGGGKVTHRRAVNQGMHWFYGSSWGIPYGIFAAASKTPPEITGPLFGLAVWAAALAHQPALDVADVPWQRSVSSLASEALFHVVYGVGAGAAVRAVRNG